MTSGWLGTPTGRVGGAQERPQGGWGHQRAGWGELRNDLRVAGDTNGPGGRGGELRADLRVAGDTNWSGGGGGGGSGLPSGWLGTPTDRVCGVGRGWGEGSSGLTSGWLGTPTGRVEVWGGVRVAGNTNRQGGGSSGLTSGRLGTLRTLPPSPSTRPVHSHEMLVYGTQCMAKHKDFSSSASHYPSNNVNIPT